MTYFKRTSGQIPLSDGTLNVNLNADIFDGYHAGNASGQVPISNGTLNVNLNADMVDGYHASITAAINRIPVSDSTGKINNAWLNTGHTANSTGINADMIDGFHASTVPLPGSHCIPVTDVNGKLNPSWLPNSGSGLNIDLLAYLDLHDSGILNSNWVLRDSNNLPKYWYINNPSNLTLTISNATNINTYIENVMYVDFTSSAQYIEITSEVIPMEAFNNNYYKLAFFLPSDASVDSTTATLTVSHIYYDSNNTPFEEVCTSIGNFEILKTNTNFNVNGATTHFHHHDTDSPYFGYSYAKLKIRLSNLSQPQTIGIASVKRTSTGFGYRDIAVTPIPAFSGAQVNDLKIIDDIKIRVIDTSPYGRVYIPNFRYLVIAINVDAWFMFSFKNDFLDSSNYIYIDPPGRNFGANNAVFAINMPQSLLPSPSSNDVMSIIHTALYAHFDIGYDQTSYTLTPPSTIYLMSPRVYQHDGSLFVNETFTCTCQCQCLSTCNCQCMCTCTCTCPCTCPCQCEVMP